MRKFFLLTLILTLTVSMNVFCTSVYADSSMQGEGTEENPYLVYTAADMFNVNNDVNACYKLMSDIDLDKQEFAPIGNASAGTFAGTFDGNGYTISNLKVSSGKYAALFGCNEGTIKNIILKNIDVSGTRYVAGVVAENAETGTVENCKVLSGKVQGSDGLNPLNIGGICGLNGGKMNGSFENRASVKSTELSSVAGGIVGKSTSDIELSDVRNSGDITGDCAGGIVGQANDISISGTGNSGDIANIECGSKNDTYDSAHFGYAAGLVGGAKQTIIITSYNTGTIRGSKQGAGLVSNGDSITIRESYNSGLIDMLTSETGGWKTTTRDPISRGLAYGSGINIQDSFSNGNITDTSGTTTYYKNHYYTISSSSNSLNVWSFERDYPKHLNVKTETEMRTKDTFSTFDLENIWIMNADRNSGYPYLRSDSNPLQINYCNKILCKGDSLQLVVFKDGTSTSDLSWKVVKGAVSVSSSGNVKAEGCGEATITAIDSEGNKVNCNLYVIEKSSNGFSLKENSWNLNSKSAGIQLDNFASSDYSDYIVKISSSDDEIISASGVEYLYFHKAGNADLTVETASGVVKTFPVSVTNETVSLKLSSTSLTLGIDHQSKLSTTIAPNPTSSTLAWSSSNTEVATVDDEGNVTGKSVGKVTITAQTDNGVKASCEVTVFKPIERIELEKDTITVYKGDTVTIKYKVYPEDATENLGVGINYMYYKEYLSLSATDGIICIRGGDRTISEVVCNAVGAYVKKTFTVSVIDYPTIVTDVTLDQTKHDMKTGEVFKLNATIVPSDATDRSITWATTDDSVASVSQVGTVTAVGAGKAVITATSGNGVISSCEVTVTGVASTNISRIYIPEIFDTKNDIVGVPVMIENNPGVSFIECTISYDKEKMSPIQISNGSLFDSVMGSIDEEKGKIKLILSSKSEVSKNGALAEIEFERKNKDEEIATLSVSYYPSKVLNASNEMVMLNITDGLLNSYHSTISGDVDENRTVDFVDALYLSRYLAKWSGYQDVREENADLNAEDGITAADLMILERYLAGWSEAKNYNIGYSA